MFRIFSLDMADPERFVITLELVPGSHSKGKSLDIVLNMAKDALKWAALTYVVAALGSLVTLLYWLSIFMGRRD